MHANKILFLFSGNTGKVMVDENGDREPNYWVWDYRPGAPLSNYYAYIDISLPKGQVYRTLDSC